MGTGGRGSGEGGQDIANLEDGGYTSLYYSNRVIIMELTTEESLVIVR